MSQTATVDQDARLCWEVVLLEQEGKISLLAKPDDVRIRIIFANRGQEYLRLPADSGPKDAPKEATILLYVDRHGTLRVARSPRVTLGCVEYSQVADWLASGHYTEDDIGYDEDGTPKGDPYCERDPEGQVFVPWGYDTWSQGYAIW